MKTYYRKPSKVEAVRLTEDNLEEVAQWCDGAIKGTKLPRNLQVVEVWNPRIDMEVIAYVGSWLVKDSVMGFCVVKDEDFTKVYDV